MLQNNKKMKHKLLITFSTVLFILYSCSLNADQESSLNQHLSKYLRAKNGCMLVGIVGFTYPGYIKELKTEGDSVLMQEMDCTTEYQKGIQYDDPTLRKVETDGNNIHVFYELDIKKGNSEKIERRAKGIVAISENNGKIWYFLSSETYKDKSKCKSLKRLLSI